MNVPFVDLRAQYETINEEIDRAIANVIADTSFIGGKYVREFEDNYAKVYDAKHCIGVANGTDAIYIALKMLGIGSGDEVITVANSWISTSETIVQTGATPVFVDIEPNYFTIDVNLIEEKITEKTKAIIPVHLYGHPVDMDPIMALAKKYRLKVIEDCAQAHFAEYKGKKEGLIGDIGTFSFYPGKNLGAYGDAGCLITNDDELADQCRMFSNHGARVKHNHLIDGINSRLDAIQAAILNAKLPFILNWTEARRNVAELYRSVLSDIKDVEMPFEAGYAKHVYHLFVIRVRERGALQAFLKENGIGTSIHYPTPLPLLPVYSSLNYQQKDIPIADSYSSQILSLPIYPELNKTNIELVSEKIREYFES